MGKSHGRRLLAITGTVSALVALSCLIVAVASPAGTPSLALIAVPVVTMLSVVGATWYLLKRDADDSEIDDFRYVDCGSCGRSILDEWRLCPYCGSRVEKPAAVRERGLV